MKLKPGLGAFYAIQPGNGVGLFHSSRTHTGRENPTVKVRLSVCPWILGKNQLKDENGKSTMGCGSGMGLSRM